ncbi:MULTISPECIES: N-acetylmuramoyl-L-alanine amidase [Streptomycetaceae]|uniref:Cell wall hydrolase/autolysin n=1 Tax=Streptantibioticus cattleyicolor (strain ATCC 35852 / DSM 46488 / JCM 4925 / NBRC 14057 / NRRL 8057) TaxID=1003195 RepID=F8K364_STREN|nr:MULTISPECIES: N-acetylmuramoyl-L-alanine amidase [Streptomycetaceae]AEW93777.1 cell wall hydrolase/autolysin [Streptantibioticus cattleyicolor NRRL 8057 = DSM 46488]MYS58463.1 N-acetylmuramoyl-L-alanine amidase [Streptomyces sp. SID5468]CCB74123.1 Cell wall hydrolase/autolysin [Streptantibioticus cattleyicolor NRRL 8057 = DSM 46488]
MSGDSGEPTRGPRRGPGGAAALAVAALVPTGFAGWLVYQAAQGHAQGHPHAAPAPVHTPTASASRPVPSPTAAGRPLAGKVVVLDPGHNNGNQFHTVEIDRQVDIGTNRKECDTTGTSTDAGYPEASFTLDVSRRVRTLLTALGAKVELTQDGDRAWGPCVDERARIANEAHADASVSVHADGGPADGRGFHVIMPAPVRAGAADTTGIAAPSRRLGLAVRSRFAADTGTSYADYLGGGSGMTVRDDLGGLNLSKVPKVFVECGNMRNARDAALLTDPAWRQRAARGISDGIAAFLQGRG